MYFNMNIIERLKLEAVVTSEEVTTVATLLANKIFNDSRKCRGRTYNQVFKACFDGRIAEVGVKKLLNADDKLDIFNDTWNVADRSTYGCDLIADGTRVEVKSHNGKWFDLPEASLNTLRNNIAASVLDIIVTASYKHQNDNYIVKPHLVIDPYKMERYMHLSQYNTTRFFFDHHAAISAGSCIAVG